MLDSYASRYRIPAQRVEDLIAAARANTLDIPPPASDGQARANLAAMAKVALAKKDSGDPFYTAKLNTARFYFAKLLPETAMLIRTARAGAKPMMDMEDALF